MFTLSNNKALVTGATGGIGKAIVKLFVQAGAKVVATGTRENALKELKTEFGDNVFTLQCNLSDKDERTQLFDKAEELVGDIDILVCNAGITRDTLALRMKDEDWEQVIDINLSSIFALNKAAIKKMSKRRYGRIINISSVTGFTGNIGQANYTAAKAGLVGLTKTLALESAARNITVNCIAPGLIETPMTETLPEQAIENFTSKIPLRRIGTPEDVASSAVFLASKQSSYITGHTLHVNGGMYMS